MKVAATAVAMFMGLAGAAQATCEDPVLYSGAHGSWLWTEFDAENSGSLYFESLSGNSGGAGVQGGFMCMLGDLVLGGEISLTLTSLDLGDSYSGTEGLATVNYGWMKIAALRGKAGVAFDNFVVYGSAGFALAGVERMVTQSNGEYFTQDESVTLAGATVGAGVSVSLDEQWWLDLQYNIYMLGSDEIDMGGGDPNQIFNISAHELSLGINFAF